MVSLPILAASKPSQKLSAARRFHHEIEVLSKNSMFFMEVFLHFADVPTSSERWVCKRRGL